MVIEIVDFPIKNGDFPVRYASLPEGITNRIFRWVCRKDAKEHGIRCFGRGNPHVIHLVDEKWWEKIGHPRIMTGTFCIMGIGKAL